MPKQRDLRNCLFCHSQAGDAVGMSLDNVSEYCVWGGQIGGAVFAKRKIVANLLFGCDGANGKYSIEFLIRSLCM